MSKKLIRTLVFIVGLTPVGPSLGMDPDRDPAGDIPGHFRFIKQQLDSIKTPEEQNAERDALRVKVEERWNNAIYDEMNPAKTTQTSSYYQSPTGY